MPWLWRISVRLPGAWAWAGAQAPMELGQGALALPSHRPPSPAAVGPQGLRPTPLDSFCQGKRKPFFLKKVKTQACNGTIFFPVAKRKPGCSAKGFHYKKEVSSGKQAVYSYCDFPDPNLLHCTKAVPTHAACKHYSKIVRQTACYVNTLAQRTKGKAPESRDAEVVAPFFRHRLTVKWTTGMLQH